jgi:alanine racemase
MSRPARALLDAGALRHNFHEVRRRAPRSRTMAVIKANGYGHGIVWAARTLSEADAFGVACIEEGVALREAGVVKPVCVLEGFFESSELALFAHYDLQTAIHHEEQLREIESARLDKPLAVWIKLDTGMHRLGFSPERLAAVLARLRAATSVGEIRVMSHFSCADDPDSAATVEQIERFVMQVKNLDLETSLANSAGIVAWPASHRDWVRPGIMLYGGAPMKHAPGEAAGLRPVMTLTTALIAVQHRKMGDPIGYGEDYRCPRDMPIGVAAIGYGDGYPRRLPAGTPVLVNGKRAALAGRVSMDMITIDLRAQPEAKAGDTVVLWGEGLPADEIAALAGTISYELFCQVTPRVPRVAG